MGSTGSSFLLITSTCTVTSVAIIYVFPPTPFTPRGQVHREDVPVQTPPAGELLATGGAGGGEELLPGADHHHPATPPHPLLGLHVAPAGDVPRPAGGGEEGGGGGADQAAVEGGTAQLLTISLPASLLKGQ